MSDVGTERGGSLVSRPVSRRVALGVIGGGLAACGLGALAGMLRRRRPVPSGPGPDLVGGSSLSGDGYVGVADYVASKAGIASPVGAVGSGTRAPSVRESGRSLIVKVLYFDAAFDDGRMTCDRLWSENDNAAVFGQLVCLVPLYEVEGEDDYVSLPMYQYVIDGHEQPVASVFALADDGGHVVDGCSFDPETGIARVPRSVCEPDGASVDVQVQLLVPCSLDDGVTYRVRWSVEDEGGQVLESGWSEADRFSGEVTVASETLSSPDALDRAVVIVDGMSMWAPVGRLVEGTASEEGSVTLPLTGPTVSGLRFVLVGDGASGPGGEGGPLDPRPAYGSIIEPDIGADADSMRKYPFGYVRDDPHLVVGALFTFRSNFLHPQSYTMALGQGVDYYERLWDVGSDKLGLIQDSNDDGVADGDLYAWNNHFIAQLEGDAPLGGYWFPGDPTLVSNLEAMLHDDSKHVNAVRWGIASKGLPGYYGQMLLFLGQDGTYDYKSLDRPAGTAPYAFEDAGFWSTIEIPSVPWGDGDPHEFDGYMPMSCLHPSEAETQGRDAGSDGLLNTVVRCRVLGIRRHTNADSYIILGLATTEEVNIHAWPTEADPDKLTIQGAGAIYKFPLRVNGFVTLEKGVSL